jgi:hypothetical protein
MGGQAFATAGPNGAPLKVPRMAPAVYHRASQELHAKLSPIFRNVTIPRDAPGKADYGDIDFLVEGALGPWTPASVKEALGATHLIGHGGTISYAVPYVDAPDQHIQVDVEISPGNGTPDSVELFQWTRFMKSDGDLMQIIGICHRSLGLTCNDRGMHIRVKEIEPQNKKKSLIFLTRDPDQALTFYGLDVSKYREGFTDQEDLFQWASSGRMFNREIFDNREEKNNDRARQKKRPMYCRFVEEYMPGHPDAGTQAKPWTRQGVLEEALQTFDRRAEYQKLMDEYMLLERDNAIWKRVKDLIPLENDSLGIVLKGLRRWVDFKNSQPFITAEPMMANSPVWAVAVTNEESVLSWVQDHWQEIGSLEKKRASAAKAAGKKRANN